MSEYKPRQCNYTAERAVINSCLFSKEALSTATELLSPDDFYDPENKAAFDVLSQMYISGIPVDIVTFTDALKNREIYERLGGQSYIDDLFVEGTPLAGNIRYHIDSIRECAIRREISLIGEHMRLAGLDYGKKISDIIDNTEQSLFRASQRRAANVRRSSEVAATLLQGIERMKAYSENHDLTITGFCTGFLDLDRITNGLQPGSLNILAARPSMGKTALALNIAQFGGDDCNAPVLVFSLEMPKEQLIMRMLSAESKVDLSALSRGMIDTDQFKNVQLGCELLSTREIYVDDTSMMSTSEFRAKCRRFQMRHEDLALVVVDYLQLMTSGERRTDNRVQEVAEISRTLKAVARELNVPVLALSQLSREAEKRTDKKPQLSDLRDSGAIEQDADLVMLLFREDYYSDNERSALTDSKADLRIAKNRNGQTGVVHLTFRREITRFLNYEAE